MPGTYAELPMIVYLGRENVKNDCGLRGSQERGGFVWAAPA